MALKPPPAPPQTDSPDQERRRLIQSTVLMFLAFGPSLAWSLYLVITGLRPALYGHPDFAQLGETLVVQIALLSLMRFFLRKQDRNLGSLGFSPRWRDSWAAAGILIAGIFAMWFVDIWFYAITHVAGLHIRVNAVNVGFARAASTTGMLKLTATLLAVVNPFFEELLVRAYLMTEIVHFTRRIGLAVLVSTVLQASYHLYQGVAPAVGYLGLFLVFSMYYARTGRIWPVILAHMFLDVTAMLM